MGRTISSPSLSEEGEAHSLTAVNLETPTLSGEKILCLKCGCAHTLPLGFSERRIIRNFSKSRPLQILKFILELGRLGSQVILGNFGFPTSCASFGTFRDFEENLIRAHSARHVTQ